MRHNVVITSLPQAFQVIKEMNLDTDQDDSDYRAAGRRSLEVILEGRMQERISWYLEEMARLGASDHRNGSFSRHLVTELGDIELAVPRTRHFSPIRIVRAYARRAPHIDRMIPTCFVLGISTRKVATALMPVLGEPVSATTVSRVAKSLDTVVAAFHRRPIKLINHKHCSQYLKGILATAFYTGMRKGEILKLTRDKLDLNNRRIKLEAIDTKTGEPRTCPICNELYRILKRYPGRCTILMYFSITVNRLMILRQPLRPSVKRQRSPMAGR